MDSLSSKFQVQKFKLSQQIATDEADSLLPRMQGELSTAIEDLPGKGLNSLANCVQLTIAEIMVT